MRTRILAALVFTAIGCARPATTPQAPQSYTYDYVVVARNDSRVAIYVTYAEGNGHARILDVVGPGQVKRLPMPRSGGVGGTFGHRSDEGGSSGAVKITIERVRVRSGN